MPNQYIETNLLRCFGCYACVIACNDHTYDINEDGAPLRRVIKYENPVTRDLSFVAVSCMNCEDALCVGSCPNGAISRDEITGFISSDKEKCVGCRTCKNVCHFDAPKFNKDNKMVICDGCSDRLKLGLPPICVKTCPSAALYMQSRENLASDKNRLTLGKILAEKDGYKSGINEDILKTIAERIRV